MLDPQKLREHILLHMDEVSTNLDTEIQKLQIIQKQISHANIKDVVELARSVSKLEGQYQTYKTIYEEFLK